MAGSFDVFFSYSIRDHAAVERIARALHDRGIRVFLDRWYLTPGLPWPQALERTLAACGAVAVFIGAEGLGPWQQRERDLALDRQGREPGFPVIPVLLTTADPGLGFLRLNTWVDLTRGLDDAEALAVLSAAIHGESPGPLGLQQSTAVRAAVCPYRGMQAFREEDEPFFFGRDSFAETLTATVLRQPFVAVVGASGSGKSSVVRAGLIPRLRRGAGGRVWDALTLVPTGRPLISLAGALLPLLEPDLDDIDWLAKVNKLAAHLAEGTIELRDVATRMLAKQPGTNRLLVFVDQWEELYTQCTDDAIRRAFVGHLLEAAGDHVCVVATIRGDFMGRALDNRDLADRLQDAVVTIGPMTRGELAETIVRPAEKTGLTWEPGLPETILDDVGDEPGGLPLLEFLLEGLWVERRGSVLTHEAYLRLGRVSGAIAHRAEEVFEQLSETERQAAHRLLIRMVRPGEGVEDTRRRTEVPRDDPLAEATILKLATARLVVTERSATPEEVTVEVAHEALIRGWQRLRNWIDANREFLRTRERIAAQARVWDAEKRPLGRLLPLGRSLAEGQDLLDNHSVELDTLLIEYIQASRKFLQRRKRMRNMAFASVVMLMLMACASAVIASVQRNIANKYGHLQSMALAALADTEVQRGSPALAVRLSLAALPPKLDSPSRHFALEAERALANGMRELREYQRFSGQQGPIRAVAYSPKGRYIATGSDDGVARLWDVASGREVVSFRGHEKRLSAVAFSSDGLTLATGAADGTARLWDVGSGREITVIGEANVTKPVVAVAFSPDGRILATGAEDNVARLWDVATGREIFSLRGHESHVRAVAFSPDGLTLATGSNDKTVRLWNVKTGHEINILSGHDNIIWTVAFSPDGRTLATGSGENTARLWDVATGHHIATLSGHVDDVTSVAFSPDGHTLVTASADHTASLWDTETYKEIGTFRGHSNLVWSIAFSPDGRSVVTGSDDGTARLWDAQRDDKVVTTLRGHQGELRSIVFSPDKRRILTASVDKTARLWDASSGRELAVFRGHAGEVLAAAFSPDGSRIATASADQTARLWDITLGQEIAVFRGHSNWVFSVAFSPDGRTLATGSKDGTARLWDLATGKEAKILQGHEDGVMTVAFSPDGETLLTGSRDATARLWDVRSGREITTLRGHERLIFCVAFSPDGRTAATGSTDNTARLWDVATGREIRAFEGHEGVVSALSFSADGRTLASGSMDTTARIWDVATGREISVHRGHNYGIMYVGFNADGSLITGSRDGAVRRWPMKLAEQDLIDRACACVPWSLTAAETARYGNIQEWCTPEMSSALFTQLILSNPPTISDFPSTTSPDGESKLVNCTRIPR